VEVDPRRIVLAGMTASALTIPLTSAVKGTLTAALGNQESPGSVDGSGNCVYATARFVSTRFSRATAAAYIWPEGWEYVWILASLGDCPGIGFFNLWKTPELLVAGRWAGRNCYGR